jgi:hypothetical protein
MISKIPTLLRLLVSLPLSKIKVFITSASNGPGARISIWVHVCWLYVLVPHSPRRPDTVHRLCLRYGTRCISTPVFAPGARAVGLGRLVATDLTAPAPIA